MMMGEVKQCAHCKGTGTCKNGFGSMRSCKACLLKAGLEENDSETTICSVCEGKGSVWIGPNVVQMPDTR